MACPPSTSAEHFPGEVVRVVDARVAAEAAIRRHQVGRISGDEDAALTESLRDACRCAPTASAIDAYREIRVTGCGTNQGNEACLADISGGVGRSVRICSRVPNDMDGEEAGGRRAVQAEEAAQGRVVDVIRLHGLSRRNWLKSAVK